MNRRVFQSLLVCLGLGACATAVGPDGAPVTKASPGECVMLFQRYDLVEQTMSTPAGYRDRMSVQPELALEAGRLRQAGCLTGNDELAAMDALPPSTAPAGTTPISPTSIHAGVVTDMNVDARAVGFFNDRGVRARSIGSAGLGRRIYLGPFPTAEQRDYAVSLARQAGFAAPYPARF